MRSEHTLVNVKKGVVIAQPTTNVTKGTLIDGNAREYTNSNAIILSGADFSAMSNAWNKITGDTVFNANADFNRDGLVSGGDFSILSANWNKVSPNTVP